MTKLQGFDNSIIEEVRPNKPHIVMIGGFWRVSKWRNKGILRHYNFAHALTEVLNKKLDNEN